MKKLFVLLFFSLLNISLYADNTQIKAVANENNIKVIEKPVLDTYIVDYIYVDEEVNILGRSSDMLKIGAMNSYWYFIEKEYGMKGWVYGYYIDIQNIEEFDSISVLGENIFNTIYENSNELSVILDNKKLFMYQPLKAVKNLLGQPDSEIIKQRTLGEEGMWDDISFEYASFSFYGMRGWPEILSFINHSNKDISTIKGIQIGSSRVDIGEEYGIGEHGNQSVSFSFRRKDQHSNDYLWFKLSNNMVIEFGFGL